MEDSQDLAKARRGHLLQDGTNPGGASTSETSIADRLTDMKDHPVREEVLKGLQADLLLSKRT